MAMFSSWISKGAEVISNSARSMSSQPTPAADPSVLLRQLLARMQLQLSKQLGQNCEGAFESAASDVLKQQELQKQVVETKEKYHTLVSQAELQQQAHRNNTRLLVQMLRQIAGSLRSEDMAAPLKELEVALCQHNTAKLEKQLKYYWKLYEAALGDYLKANLTTKTDECKDEINLFKGLNKNLEVELFRSRNACADLESRLSDLHARNSEMAERLSILQKLGAESAVLASNKEKQKAHEKQNQLLEKIRMLEKEKIKLERLLKQTTGELQKSNASITVVKQTQQKLIQQMQAQIARKQASYQASVTKVCMEKIHLQEKLKSLHNTVELLEQQVQSLKTSQHTPKKDTRNVEIKQLNDRIIELEEKVQECNGKLQVAVSKQMMKTLFLGYEDESKEWSIRRDVRNQIYSLLGVKIKQEAKQEEKKWFGIF